MNIKDLDLNLLRLFDAVWRLRSVRSTLAGAPSAPIKLGMVPTLVGPKRPDVLPRSAG